MSSDGCQTVAAVIIVSLVISVSDPEKYVFEQLINFIFF